MRNGTVKIRKAPKIPTDAVFTGSVLFRYIYKYKDGLLCAFSILAVVLTFETTSDAQTVQSDKVTFREAKAFFKTHCIKCHGSDAPKADFSLLKIESFDDAKSLNDESLEKWEQILDAIESEEMPPEDAAQPSDAKRKSITDWIKTELKKQIESNSDSKENAHQIHTATTRRLTNLEYENTIRDLIGFRMKLIDRLPEDPKQPVSIQQQCRSDAYRTRANRSLPRMCSIGDGFRDC